MEISEKILAWVSSSIGDGFIIVVASILMVVAGFFLLIKGADFFVDGASKIAERLKVPLIVIGLTIVAFGTSAPEAAISITSACQDNAGMAIGNVFGSNILNVLMILGVSALFSSLAIKKNTFRYEIPFVAVITLIFLFLGVFGGAISRLDGIILLMIMGLFMLYLIFVARKAGDGDDEVPSLTAKDTLPKMIFLIIIGLAAIVVGSDMTVAGASKIASMLGVTDRVIGLTIVAFGTSLPELVTSVSAARKHKADIAIGNIIGSNIFNILFVIGIAAVVSPSPIKFENSFIFDGVVATLVPVVLGVLVLRDKKLKRSGGVIMLLLYAAYFTYLCITQIAMG